MQVVVSWIDVITKWIGEKSSYLNAMLVLLICVDVVFRYVFSQTQVWVLELEWHLFSIVFLLGAAYTLQQDKHVRVDLWYGDRSSKTKAWINLIGSLLFLVPWCIILMRSSFNYAINSWMMNEGSPNPGGLPMRYVIKFIIVLAFFLLLLQGIAVILRSIMTILNKSDKVN